MKAKEYIIDRIKELQVLCSNHCIQIRYAYDDVTNFHIVEVSPETIRRGDKVYMEWEYSTIKEFRNLFPEEDLLISEPDGCNNMSNTIYSYDGFRNKPRRKGPTWSNAGFSEFMEKKYSLAA